MDQVICRYQLHDAHMTAVFDSQSPFTSMRAAKAKARKRTKAHLEEHGLGHYKIGRWALDNGFWRAIVRDPSMMAWHRDDDIRYTLVLWEVE